MLSIRFFFASVLLLCSFNNASASDSAEKATKLLRSLCLAGNSYEIKADGGGSLKILNKSIDGSITFSETELDGKVDVSDGDKIEELNNIRLCIKPYIGKIMNSVLDGGDGSSSVDEANDKLFLYEDFSEVEEGLTPVDWLAAENILVEIRNGEYVLTQNPRKSKNRITIPNLSFPDDFVISVSAKIKYDGWLVIKLSNNIFAFEANGKRDTTFRINKAGKMIKESFIDQKAIFSIKKEGSVFKLYVNGVKKIVSRINGFEKPEAIEINFDEAVNGFEMHKIEAEKI